MATLPDVEQIDDDATPEREAREAAAVAEVMGAWPPLTVVDRALAQVLWAQLLASARRPGPVPFPETTTTRYIERLAVLVAPETSDTMTLLRHHAERAEVLLRCQRQPPTWPSMPNGTR